MFKEWFVDSRERRRLKAALAPEIRAVLSQIVYLTNVQEKLVADIQKTGDIGKLFVQFRGNYNVVFAAAADRLGLLHFALIEDLVTFHYQVQHVLESFEIATKEDANAQFHDELLRTLREARDLGCSLVDRLEDASLSTGD